MRRSGPCCVSATPSVAQLAAPSIHATSRGLPKEACHTRRRDGGIQLSAGETWRVLRAHLHTLLSAANIRHLDDSTVSSLPFYRLIAVLPSHLPFYRLIAQVAGAGPFAPTGALPPPCRRLNAALQPPLLLPRWSAACAMVSHLQLTHAQGPNRSLFSDVCAAAPGSCQASLLLGLLTRHPLASPGQYHWLAS